MRDVAHIRRLCFSILSLLVLSACAPQDASMDSGPAPAAMTPPPQRSYLDVGPGAPRAGGPNYIRDGLTSSTRQTDFFGNDVLPRSP